MSKNYIPIKKHVATAVIAILLTACSNDDMPGTHSADMLSGTPVKVNARVAGIIARSGIDNGNLDNLGLSILNAGNSRYSYSNVHYVKSGSEFAPDADETQKPFWQNSAQKVTVTAYSPYNAEWTGETARFTVATDQSSSIAGSMNSDLLWVSSDVVPELGNNQAGNGITFNTGNTGLDINLQHMMCKLSVNLYIGNEITNPGLQVDGLTVKNLNTALTFNLTTGQITNLTDVAAISAYNEAEPNAGYSKTYDVIFPPQESAFTIEISFKDSTRRFSYTNSGFNFISGNAYVINLLVGKDKIELTDDITVSSWKEGTADDFITE